MFKKLLFISLSLLVVGPASGQRIDPAAWQKFPDSIIVAAHASYDHVNGFHRWLFGENYRKEWALPVKMPLIRLSALNGGLLPVKEGGGMESTSLRLVDKTGREWVLRSVEKKPEKLLPPGLDGTFTVDWVDDEFSEQHPYSALIVPPLADAARVSHANPVIGVVADDPALGIYRKMFTGMVCLLEEREPSGASDNTFKMMRTLDKGYDSRLDGEAFLRARLLDLLIGDWDRHEDQWRFAGEKQEGVKVYTAVPRDRDQVFHVREGIFPSIAGLPWLDPVLGKFSGGIPDVKFSLYKTRFLNQVPGAQFSHETFMRIVHEFVAAETDGVLEEGLKRLPRETYVLRHRELFNILKRRRANIPAAMETYFRFISRIVDIRATDRSEQMIISDEPDGALKVTILPAGKGRKDTLFTKIYESKFTDEIRLYTGAGSDSLSINIPASNIKLRVIDSSGKKTFVVKAAGNKVNIYSGKDNVSFTGDSRKVKLQYPANSTARHFVPVNLYNLWQPIATAAGNRDDGFLLGLGFKYTGVDGFRKLPYTTIQQLMLTHSFSTQAFRVEYYGEWTQALHKADILLHASAQAPDNTMNFFGQGNLTALDKSGDYHRFYRSRFDLYVTDGALRWHTGTKSTISAGPSLQYYRIDPADNNGRFIAQSGVIRSYDSTSLNNNKLHAGIVLNFISNRRDNNMLPTGGYYLKANMQLYAGMNNDARSYAQFRPEFTYYQKIDSAARFVLSNRIGGGISVGNPAFYQSMFLGGQGNLLGYLQNRFSGQQMIYNNFQARYKLANVAGYILPGQLGLSGFYDIGRVWIDGEHTDLWHQGVGGGLYFSPAGLTVVQLLAGHSKEGWYPYLSFNFRL